MKTLNLIKITTLATLVAAAGINQSCNRAGAKAEQEQAIVKPEIFPDLLKRNAALTAGTEWDQVNILTGSLFDRIRKNPNDLAARLKLAEVYMLEARVTGEHGHYYPAALQMINTVLERKPTQDERFQALSLQTSVYLSLHQFSKALQTGQEAVKINGYNAQIYGGLVDANVELGNYDEAVKLCDKMMSIRPDIRSYSRASYLREIHGQEQGAIEAMKLAVTAGLPGQEDHAWARLTLGNLYQTYGDLGRAEAEYKMILKERPGYAFAIAGLAEVQAKKGNLQNAEKLLKQACEIMPEVSFYEQLAQLYNQTNRAAEATKVTEEILAMMNDDEKAGHMMHLQRAKVYLDLANKPDLALAEAQKEFAKRPANIDVARVMAEIEYRRGNNGKATEYLSIANKTKSNNPELQTLSGLVAYNNGKSAEGKLLVKKALQTNPYLSVTLATQAKAKLAS